MKKEKSNKQLSPQEEKNILQKIQKCRIDLLLHYPFFGILSLRFQIVQSYKLETMSINNASVLRYNPIFISELKEEEIKFVIIHEIMHCALRHISRKNGRNLEAWNIAIDYAANAIIMNECSNNKDCILSMPSGKYKGLYDKKYDNMTAEEIYNDIIDDFNNFKNIVNGFDEHNWENINDAIDMENQWEMNIISAANTVNSQDDKSSGSIPGFFERYINNIVNPTKDWRILLREYIEPEANDYTFQKPDYRIDYDEFGCFLPSFDDEQDAVKKILFYMDTSGSVDDKEADIIYSEIAGAVQQFDTFEGYLGFFDSVAYEPKPFVDINSLKEIKPIGGGGTNFKAPFEYVKEHTELDNIKCIIMMTDGYCDFPSETIIDIPVIWLITTENIKAPWGQSIYLPLNK